MTDSPPRSPLRVAELKARLSYYLHAVRAGRSLTVYDRDTPVARLIPVDPGPGDLPSVKPSRRLRDVPLPPPLRRSVGSAAALREERRDRR
jgi:antitoxin (DNA-binding transcriptional repressor) of toxin-antitoxin stability system